MIASFCWKTKLGDSREVQRLGALGGILFSREACSLGVPGDLGGISFSHEGRKGREAWRSLRRCEKFPSREA